MLEIFTTEESDYYYHAYEAVPDPTIGQKIKFNAGGALITSLSRYRFVLDEVDLFEILRRSSGKEEKSRC